VSYFYKLEGKLAIPVNWESEYIEWLLGDPDQGRRVVASDKLEYQGGEIHVSTVFILGINHAFGDGDPLLFETMVFEGPMDGYQVRYSTWEQAEIGHREALRELFQQVPELEPPRGEYATRFERILRDD
jgi:hypothetical protein